MPLLYEIRTFAVETGHRKRPQGYFAFDDAFATGRRDQPFPLSTSDLSGVIPAADARSGFNPR